MARLKALGAILKTDASNRLSPACYRRAHRPPAAAADQGRALQDRGAAAAHAAAVGPRRAAEPQGLVAADWRIALGCRLRRSR